jgi:two-component system nitrate/nitrite sensor histidine kinase NarX
MKLPWRRASLAAKLGAVGSLLLVLALASVGLTLWVTRQLEGGAAAVNEAGRLRMQTWRLAQAVDARDAARFDGDAAHFSATLALLRQGDPARPLSLPADAETQAALAAVVQASRAQIDAWAAEVAAPAVGPPGAARTAAAASAQVGRVDALVSAIEHRLSFWTGILTAFQLGLMGLAIAGGVAMLYASVLFVFNPLLRLQRGLAQVEAGDLGARVDAVADGEFGALAGGFNRMAERLQVFTRGLEQQVAQKTEILQAERERLAALYDASAFVGRAETLDELARGFVRQLRRVARADAAALRWLDAEQGHYVLLASDALPAGMAEDEQCLRIGQCHCGAAPAASQLRVLPIHPVADAASACQREGFERIVRLPVRLKDQLLGELDLLYRGSGTLADTERALLENLAAHLAGGMQALRAQALEREAAVAEERALLARELHDSIAQSLAFLKIQAQLLRVAQTKGDATGLARALDELDAGLKESTADVRELLLHFRTRPQGDSIVPALQQTLRKFEHQSGLQAHFEVHGHGVPLPPDQQTQLLHIVQEALSNVRKHAGAGAVWVDLHPQPDWRISVRDDGAGFDAAARPPDETHVGLRIMRERAQSIGARVAVHSAPGAGTRVEVVLPRSAENSAAPAGEDQALAA